MASNLNDEIYAYRNYGILPDLVYKYNFILTISFFQVLFYLLKYERQQKVKRAAFSFFPENACPYNLKFEGFYDNFYHYHYQPGFWLRPKSGIFDASPIGIGNIRNLSCHAFL